MKIKLMLVMLACVVASGCASTPDKAARNFLAGASNSAKSRQLEQSKQPGGNKRKLKSELMEDSVSGILTALYRGIFTTKSTSN